MEGTGNLKGKAMTKANFIFKKKHPIKWRIYKFLQFLSKKLR